MKRIAVFCDGTWNTPDKLKDGKRCQTNVVKMANALKPVSTDGKPQVLYYDAGIGSEGSLIRRVYDGATGTGISENILKAYRFLIRNYQPGDELFLFGFSRGAFTVRSLAGLIRNSGILKLSDSDQINRAYEIYRSRKPEYQPREVEATLFRRTFAIEETTRIKFIGVWDTVGALGNPLFLNGILSRRNRFHDTQLSSKIGNAFQALAVDEKRRNFQATLWNQQDGVKGQKLEQVWFPGVHSDVGGGYPDNESGLSDISLRWMLEKAQNCNLSFESVTINPDPLAPLHESYRGFYMLLPRLFRQIAKADKKKGNTYESVDPSTEERYKKNIKYRPENLVDYFRKHPF
jgi:uncharacterized protein (DUF2235 family)